MKIIHKTFFNGTTITTKNDFLVDSIKTNSYYFFDIRVVLDLNLLNLKRPQTSVVFAFESKSKSKMKSREIFLL